jgi:hypothetical protein
MLRADEVRVAVSRIYTCHVVESVDWAHHHQTLLHGRSLVWIPQVASLCGMTGWVVTGVTQEVVLRPHQRRDENQTVTDVPTRARYVEGKVGGVTSGLSGGGMNSACGVLW